VRRLSRLAGTAVVAVALAAVAAVAGDTRQPPLSERAVSIDAHPITHFRIGRPDEHSFGRLRFVGGFELEADTRAVSGLSGLMVRDAGAALTAITDRGVALVARIDRDPAGRPVGLADARIKGLETAGSTAGFSGFAEPDAEGFAHSTGGAEHAVYVSFETVPRIMTATLDTSGLPGPLTDIALPAPIRSLRHTKGLESLALAPENGPLSGHLVAIAERAERSHATADQPGWVLDTDGETIASFRLADSGFDVTDAAFAPDGSLWVLERRFTLVDGVSMRLRRIETDDLVDGARIAGTEMLTADLAHQIDNMEAMAFWITADGRTMLSLLSDDNGSFLQRTVYLEFEVAA
jgi:hypothetical protein